MFVEKSVTCNVRDIRFRKWSHQQLRLGSVLHGRYFSVMSLFLFIISQLVCQDDACRTEDENLLHQTCLAYHRSQLRGVYISGRALFGEMIHLLLLTEGQLLCTCLVTASIRVVPLTRLLAGRTSLIRPYSGEVLSCSGRPFHQVLVLQSIVGVAKICYFLGLMVIGISFHFSPRKWNILCWTFFFSTQIKKSFKAKSSGFRLVTHHQAALASQRNTFSKWFFLHFCENLLNYCFQEVKAENGLQLRSTQFSVFLSWGDYWLLYSSGKGDDFNGLS